MSAAALTDFAERLRAEFDAAFTEPVRATNAGLRDFVLVATGDRRWALPLAGLRAIEHDLALTPVPSSRPALLGLAGVRSVVVPVFALGELLGVPPAAGSQAWRRAPIFALMSVTPTEMAGVAVERLLQFARVGDRSMMQPAGGIGRTTLQHEEETYTVVEAAELLQLIRSGDTAVANPAQPANFRTTERIKDGDSTR